MKTMSKNLWLFVALLVFAASSAFAATQNAVVYGTVYDATGTPLAGVSVSLDNPALGFSRSTTTGSDGSYNFAEVPPAEGYRLTAARGGNKIDIRSGITVNVGDERVILPPLKEQPVVAAATGSKPEVKEKKIEGQGVHNETVSTAISGVISGDQLRTLPLYNRNFLALGLLTPNTHDVEGGSALAGASFSVAGTAPSTNNFLLDGSDNVASSSNQAIPFQVNDSIQEFRVTSSNASAEYGRNLGGTVNIVTRRGGNGFHGSVYGYFGDDALNGDNPISVYRGSTFDKNAAYAGTAAYNNTLNTAFPLRYNDYVNTALNNGFCTNSIGVATANACATGGTGANDLFDPAAILATNDSRTSPFNSKQFGLSAGGALIKNKLFLFGSYEGTVINNPNPIFERVPSNFDRSYNILASRAGYAPVNFGPNSADFTMGQSILSLFPQPNVTGVADALEFYRGTAPNYTNVHNGLLRGDWVLGSKTTVGARYVAQMLDQLHDDSLPKQPQYPGNGALRTALNQNALLNVSHSFTNALIDELRFGVTRFGFKELAQDRGFDATTLGGTVKYPTSSMPTVLLNGLDDRYSGAQVGIDGASCGWSNNCTMAPTLNYLFPFARLGAPLNAPSSRRDTTWSIADNLSWTHGKHGFKFGFEYRNIFNQVGEYGLSRGFVYSSNIGEFTSDSNTCVDCGGATMEFPSFDFSQQQYKGYEGRFSSHAYSFYVQDTWRFHPRWTLNLGVRYEYFSVPQDDNHQTWNYDPVANGLVQSGTTAATDQYGFVCGDTLPYGMYPNNFNTDLPAPGTPDGNLATGGPWANCNGTGSARTRKDDKNNFAPRVGLAWDIAGNGKSVLRFGYGMFYDQQPTSTIAQLLYNRPTTLQQQNAVYGLVNDTVGVFCGSVSFCGAGNSFLNIQQAFGGGFNDFVRSQSPNAVYAIDTAHSDTPYSRQINFSWQQELTNKFAFEVGYVGTKTWNLPQLYDASFQREWTLFTPNNFTSDSFANTPILTMANRGNSTYNSLLVRGRMADLHGLRLNATYTFAKANDNASSGRFPQLPVTGNNLAWGYQFRGSDNPVVLCIYVGACNSFFGTLIPTFPNIDFAGGAVTTTGMNPAITSQYDLPQDPFHPNTNDWGPSNFDTRQRFVMDYTWDLPFSKKNILLGNWSLSGITTLQSGQPFTIFAGPILGQIYERANVSGNLVVDDHNPNGMLPTAGVTLPTAGCLPGGFLVGISPFLPHPGEACTGNSGKNQFVGPTYMNTNFAVQKGFHIFGEGRTLTFRSEFYNLFNRANYYNPISQVSTDGFTANPNYGQVKSAHDPRQIQFAVRFNW
jgi:hypothetical protein